MFAIIGMPHVEVSDKMVESTLIGENSELIDVSYIQALSGVALWFE